jgi:hypothetical protein
MIGQLRQSMSKTRAGLSLGRWGGPREQMGGGVSGASCSSTCNLVQIEGRSRGS